LLNDRLRIEDQIWIRYFQQISSLALTEHLTYLPAVSVLHLDQMLLLRSGLMSATPQVLWSLVKCSGPEENWARKKTGPRRKLGPEENWAPKKTAEETTISQGKCTEVYFWVHRF
jgi:hypothetical protein